MYTYSSAILIAFPHSLVDLLYTGKTEIRGIGRLKELFNLTEVLGIKGGMARGHLTVLRGQTKGKKRSRHDDSRADLSLLWEPPKMRKLGIGHAEDGAGEDDKGNDRESDVEEEGESDNSLTSFPDEEEPKEIHPVKRCSIILERLNM